MTHFFLVGFIFFAAHLVSSVTGFGAAILALPVLTLLVGLDAGKQSLALLGMLLCLFITWRWRALVNRGELLRILLIAAPGLAAGMLLFEYLPVAASTLLLGLFVITVALRGLLSSDPAGPPARPNWIARVLLLLGGFVHGAFNTGGPLLVVYCRRALPDKSVFRATLSAMWLLLGAGLMSGWTLAGAWHPHTPRLTLAGLPFLMAGLAAGEYLHHRADPRRFATAVHLTLLGTGGVLCWSALQ